MGDDETSRSIELQSQIQARLQELGVADGPAILRLSRHLAEIAVMGRNFAEHSLPLFLAIDRDHQPALHALLTSIKCDLEQIGDGIRDCEEDLLSLMAFFQERGEA